MYLALYLWNSCVNLLHVYFVLLFNLGFHYKFGVCIHKVIKVSNLRNQPWTLFPHHQILSALCPKYAKSDHFNTSTTSLSHPIFLPGLLQHSLIAFSILVTCPSHTQSIFYIAKWSFKNETILKLFPLELIRINPTS